MNKNNRKIIIIGFFAFTWLVMVFSDNQGYNFLQVERSQAYENSSYEMFDISSSIEIYNPEVDDVLIPTEQTIIARKLSQNTKEANFFDDPEVEFCGDFLCYTEKEFLEIYNVFEKKTELEKKDLNIYNNVYADNHIKEIAERRGYKKRVFANESKIIDFESIRTHPLIRDAYKKMRNEMKKEGILLHFVSGYRNSSDQRSIFTKKMGQIDIEKITTGNYDEKIMEVLNISSIPGYSKHHSGFTADFGCGNDYLVYDFANTSCYKWMSKNNFENAKRFGFLPSYPNGLSDQGPNAEPWEFVWVGDEFLE